MMRFDGAFSRGGFSTIWVIENSLPLRSPTPTTPYMCDAVRRHLLDAR